MKITRAFTVDLQAWMAAKSKVTNLSGYVSDTLFALAAIPDTDDPKDLEDAKKLINAKTAELALLQEQLRKFERKKTAEANDTARILGGNDK